jgi:hypothetical protein
VNVLAAPSAVEEADLPGGGGEVLGGAEKITLQQAFDLFTVKAAEQMGDRYRTASFRRDFWRMWLFWIGTPTKFQSPTSITSR